MKSTNRRATANFTHRWRLQHSAAQHDVTTCLSTTESWVFREIMATKSHRRATSTAQGTVYTWNPKSWTLGQKVTKFNQLQTKIKSNLQSELERRTVHIRVRWHGYATVRRMGILRSEKNRDITVCSCRHSMYCVWRPCCVQLYAQHVLCV